MAEERGDGAAGGFAANVPDRDVEHADEAVALVVEVALAREEFLPDRFAVVGVQSEDLREVAVVEEVGE